jgi:hypothetical protein
MDPALDNVSSLMEMAVNYSGMQMQDPNLEPGRRQRKPLMEWDFSSIQHIALLSAALLYKDKKLALIVPYQIAYGLTSSMVTYYVLTVVIGNSPSLGGEYVGFYAGVIVAAGALVSSPMGHYADLQGKAFIIGIGNMAMLCCGLLLFMFSDDELGTWAKMMFYCIVFGIGRGVWVSSRFVCLFIRVRFLSESS